MAELRSITRPPVGRPTQHARDRKSALMPYRKILPAVLTLLLLIPAVGIRSAEQTLIGAGSSWKYQRQRLEPRHGLAGSGLQRRELAGGAGAAWLRGRRRIDGPVLRQQPLQPAHHVLLQARLHGRGSGGHRGPDAPLRAGRRVHHLSQRRGSRPVQHARRHRDLYDAGDGIHRRRRRERVASGPPRSVAAGHGDQRHRRGDPPAVTLEQRHQLRSRAAGHGGPDRGSERDPDRSREPEPVQHSPH